MHMALKALTVAWVLSSNFSVVSKTVFLDNVMFLLINFDFI